MWFLSDVGNAPTLNVRSDIFNCVESYVVHMLLACRLKIIPTSSLKLIISVLVSSYYYYYLLYSSPARVGMLLFLFLLCCISGLGPKGLLQTHSMGMGCCVTASKPSAYIIPPNVGVMSMHLLGASPRHKQWYGPKPPAAMVCRQQKLVLQQVSKLPV